MDWNAVIEQNHAALKRILAALVAMAGLCPHAEVPAAGEPRRTLPRRLHRAVCRLLRPAEAAARRLVIVAARDLVVTAPPPREPGPRPAAIAPLLRGLGIAVTVSPAEIARMAAERRAAARRAARPRTLALPLADPLRKYRPWRPILTSVPRIRGFDGPSRPLPARALPDDPVDAARLALRLQALGRALDDLPGQARRFARWRARADAALAQAKQRYGAGAQLDRQLYGAGWRNRRRDGAGDGKARRRFPRVWPLQPGHPPGWRRRPTHEVHGVLADLHHFAFHALQRQDTS